MGRNLWRFRMSFRSVFVIFFVVLAAPSVISLHVHHVLSQTFHSSRWKVKGERHICRVDSTFHSSHPAIQPTLVVKWPQSRSWRSGRSGKSLTFPYPPRNQHIPPGGKETHLQKCLWLWIRYSFWGCSVWLVLNAEPIAKFARHLVGNMAIPTAHLLITIRTSWLLMIVDGSNLPLQWNNFFCSPPKSKQSMGMIISPGWPKTVST